MLQVHLATVKDGQIQLINPVLLPDGTKILVTVLESENTPQETGDWEQWLLFEETSQQLQSEEYLDRLTKIGNRRYFDNYLVQFWQQQKARNQPIALILIDIDFFHPYNGKYGHQQGDDCLVTVAQCIANVPKRPMSAVARYGGEEFALILPNTMIDDALIVAESIRNAVSSLAIPNSGYYEEVGSYLTISLGVESIIPSEETTLEDLIKTADYAIYRAKNQGRDQVFAFDLDELTQVDSRRSFDHYLEKVWQHSKRKQEFLSLVLICVDYFRKYNDNYGHLEGDKCLINIAQTITKTTEDDYRFIARYSQDEFAVLLPDADIKEALIVAESIKNAIAELAIPHVASTISDRVTVSMGMATIIPNKDNDAKDLISRADKFLVKAKEQGRNRIECVGTDPLTGLWNRKYFNDYLEYFWQKQKREEKPLSLILINIDSFKKYNDRYGHPEGDNCLTAIAQAIAKALPRPTDLAFRYAGGEFTVLLPNTNVNSAFSMAESIKKEIDSLAIPHADSFVTGYLTVSMGVATIIPNDQSKALDLLQKAETAHYFADHRDRNPNQICSHDLDQLTKLANRRYFDHYLTQVWQQHQRKKQSLSLILIDIDYLKKYNNQHNLVEADECFIRIAQCLAKLPQISTDLTDLIARVGGDEFAVILPYTKMENALNVAKSIRKAVLALAIPHGKSDVSDYVTISLGISTFIPSENNSPDDLIKTADTALYQAKQTGRNQVLGLDLDELTQLPNRQFFDNCLAKTWQHHQRLNLPVALILVTVDYFKKYQEHYGNEAADNCLVSIAQAIAELCKKNYERLVARYDEDTFSIILPNTSTKKTSVIAESIKQAVTSLEIPNISYPQAGSFVAVSLGFSSLIPSPENVLENLINTAEIAILTLQNQGHDQIFSTDLDELCRQDNRQCFREYLTQAWQQHQSANQPLGLILVDVDYMNAYLIYHLSQNNEGLQKTNDYLIHIAKAIAKLLKDQPHLIARYNGENIGGEFAILLPNTNLEEVFVLAKSIGTFIPSWPSFPIPSYGVYGGSLRMTERLGVSSLIPNPENAPQDLINEANRVLFLNQYGELNFQYSSAIDTLTTLPNRQGLYNYLAPLWQQYLEKQQYVTLILVNIDLLKYFNYVYGFGDADQCIISVAQAIDQLFKKQDIVSFVAYYGGGIFSIILPESDLNQASILAELIETELASLAIPIFSVSGINNIDSVLNNPNVKLAPFLVTNETSNTNSYVTYVTVSMGITQVIPNVENCPNDLFQEAKVALYLAKGER